MKVLPLRIVLPIVAVACFVGLCLMASGQAHVIDKAGWGSDSRLLWEEPEDIGTPADVLLLALNLPALIALLPLLPFAGWIESETVLRGFWAAGSAGQWFVVGYYLDVRRGLVSGPSFRIPRRLRQLVFGGVMVAGTYTLGFGISVAVSGHQAFWGIVMSFTLVLWGLFIVMLALRWRSSPSWTREDIVALRLS